MLNLKAPHRLNFTLTSVPRHSYEIFTALARTALPFSLRECGYPDGERCVMHFARWPRDPAHPGSRLYGELGRQWEV